MKTPFLAALLILITAAVNPAQAQSESLVAGRDYIVIEGGRPMDPADDYVVVEEFFNYICPACNNIEPHFAAWTKQLPSYAKLAHVPAAFRADFVQYARAYYAAQSFGLIDKTHQAVYDAIHRTHVLPSEGERPDEERIAAFYADYGVDAEDFLSAMRSFDVDFKIRRATDHMQRSRVSGTPMVVINGRYLVRGTSYADMLRIASELIEREHAD